MISHLPAMEMFQQWSQALLSDANSTITLRTGNALTSMPSEL
jgi:hypothetical protein